MLGQQHVASLLMLLPGVLHTVHGSEEVSQVHVLVKSRTFEGTVLPAFDM